MTAVGTMPEIHPLADLVPSMTEAEYAELREDVARNGLLDPIVLYDGKVLDGRHRLRACNETNTEPQFKDYDGDEPASFVLSHNLHRRNLDESQKAMLAVNFLPELEREARARQAHGQTAPGQPMERLAPQGAKREPKAAERAAEKTGASSRLVERAKRVKEADPDLAEKVLQGDVKVGTAEREVVAREKATRNGQKPQKSEKGKRLPQAIVRVARKLDDLLDALNEVALRKSCEGLTDQERQAAAESYSKAATKFRAMANALAPTGKDTA